MILGAWIEDNTSWCKVQNQREPGILTCRTDIEGHCIDTGDCMLIGDYGYAHYSTWSQAVTNYRVSVQKQSFSSLVCIPLGIV